jgi:hypothetical protein
VQAAGEQPQREQVLGDGVVQLAGDPGALAGLGEAPFCGHGGLQPLGHAVEAALELGDLVAAGHGHAAAQSPSATAAVVAASRRSRPTSPLVDSRPKTSPTGTAAASTSSPTTSEVEVSTGGAGNSAASGICT